MYGVPYGYPSFMPPRIFLNPSVLNSGARPLERFFIVQEVIGPIGFLDQSMPFEDDLVQEANWTNLSVFLSLIELINQQIYPGSGQRSDQSPYRSLPVIEFQSARREKHPPRNALRSTYDSQASSKACKRAIPPSVVAVGLTISPKL
jgi:hypothetical protein